LFISLEAHFCFLKKLSKGGENIFDFLRHNPEFNALRFMVQQNPALLQPILGQLGQANPELLQLITSHQAEFTQLLNEPVNEADLPQQLAGGGGAGGGGARFFVCLVCICVLLID
jgi:hypothetical protein